MGRHSRTARCSATGEVFLWSRGEELITERFPEIAAAARGTPRRHGARRRGPRVRARRAAAVCRPAAPHRASAAGCARLRRTCRWCSWRTTCSRTAASTFARMPLRDRRAPPAWTSSRGAGPLRVSEDVGGDTWEALAGRRDESRARHVEGLMLKRWTSPYRPGRKRGDWWKWKIDPFTVDAVLMYAQPGSGRRASLFTDYTFGVWDGDELVPVAKAYSGLSDEEIDEAGSLGAAAHDGAVRSGERGGAGPRLRARVRANRALDAAQVRSRRPLSADPALAPRQDRRAKPTRWRRCSDCWPAAVCTAFGR